MLAMNKVRPIMQVGNKTRPGTVMQTMKEKKTRPKTNVFRSHAKLWARGRDGGESVDKDGNNKGRGDRCGGGTRFILTGFSKKAENII